MFLRYRMNMIYRDLGPLRDGTVLEVEPEVIVKWLGFIERDIARAWADVLNAREVSLTKFARVHGWKASELDQWQWIEDHESFVGFLVEQGVFAVVERGQPLLKRMPYSGVS